MTVFEKIEAMQKGKENTALWMVGEHLKDICRREPGCAGIVAEDLENPDMGLEACEKRIKAYADANHGKNKCFCVPPQVSEGIIRKFYGLPEAGKSQAHEIPEAPGLLNLEDFLA